MRTTIDLPDDLHDLARHLAHEGNRSMSDVIAELIRAGLRRPASPASSVGPRGMPLVSVGRTVTAEDVRSLDDDE
jgi:predicted transcriptional regulator